MKFLFSILFSFITYEVAAQNYNPVSFFREHEGGITTMTRDPSGKFLIAGDENGFLYFHDLTSGNPVSKVKAHGAPVTQLRFNSNGRLLISATRDGEIKIYDQSKQKIIQAIFSPDYSGIRFVLFSIADGFIYFNGRNRLFKTRSDLTQKVEQVMHQPDSITDAVITSDRSALILSCGTRLMVMNTRTDNITQDFNAGNALIDRITLINDSTLATWSVDGTINFRKYFMGQLNLLPDFFLKAGLPAQMNFSEDGRLMCTGNIGNWMRVWEPKQRKIIQELFSHTATVTASCFGINSDYLFTSSLDHQIILWKNGAPPLPVPVLAIKIQDTIPKTEEKKIPKDVVMGETNIPKIISGRKVISNQKIEVTSSELTVYVYDNSYIDGDTMSLFFNGQWILDHYGVTKTKQPVKINLTPNTNNYLVLFANNLGKSPPNTAAIEFDDGKSKHFFRLASDLKSCSAINFFYRK